MWGMCVCVCLCLCPPKLYRYGACVLLDYSKQPPGAKGGQLYTSKGAHGGQRTCACMCVCVCVSVCLGVGCWTTGSRGNRHEPIFTLGLWLVVFGMRCGVTQDTEGGGKKDGVLIETPCGGLTKKRPHRQRRWWYTRQGSGGGSLHTQLPGCRARHACPAKERWQTDRHTGGMA